MTSLPTYLEKQAYLFRLNKARKQVWLPKAYPLQREIIQHPAKRKVVCCGRQFGKTFAAGLMSIGGEENGGQGLLDGKRVLISSTSQDQADTFWEYITDWLKDVPNLYKNESRRIIKLGSGLIRVKTGSDPDVLRGGTYDLLILDECAYLDPDAWYKVGIPMLLKTDGTAVFLTTPKRRNWFFVLYNHAVGDTSGRWKAWNASTHENPTLNQMALDELTADMTEDDYQQEILAHFLENSGAVFRYIDERCILQPREPYIGRFVFGVDWAQKNDFTVITVLDKDTRQMVAYERFNKVDWALQRGRLRSLYDAWKPSVIWAEENSVGNPNIEALQREGLPIEPFTTTAQSKPPLIESLVLAFDRGEIIALDDGVFKGELMAYERKLSSTGRSQYSAPSGMHDDCVMSMALAWHGVTTVYEMKIDSAPDLLQDW